MQHVCSNLIFNTLPWTYALYQQIIGRIVRTGMNEKKTVEVVKGNGKCDLYQWLSDKSKNGWNEKEPSWNFCKYDINEKGELQNFFASGIKPSSPEFLAAIGK